jgi:glycosyltransferase involved in cell wall biosynthesis
LPALKTKRITLDCVAARNPVSGLYQVCLNLGNALLKQAEPAAEQFTFYVHKSQPQLFGKDQRYIIQNETQRFFQHKLQACDVWHSSIQDARIKPRNRRIKVVLTIHDLNFLIQRKDEPGKIKKYLGRVQANVNRADHIVCISEFTKQTVLQHLKTNGKPVDVIYNGSTVKEFPGFETPDYGPAKPFIFALGALVPKKNFHVLPCLLQHNDYELVIAGTRHKEYEQLILAQAASFGVSNRVKLLGEISEEEKYWYYKHCSAFVFPSLAEGFGLPLIEAMYFGKPAFVSKATSLPEVGGDLAYYFEQFEPEYMQRIFAEGMAHYDTTKPMKAIRERALKYSWDQAAIEYLSVYHKLI